MRVDALRLLFFRPLPAVPKKVHGGSKPPPYNRNDSLMRTTWSASLLDTLRHLLFRVAGRRYAKKLRYSRNGSSQVINLRLPYAARSLWLQAKSANFPPTSIPYNNLKLSCLSLSNFNFLPNSFLYSKSGGNYE